MLAPPSRLGLSRRIVDPLDPGINLIGIRRVVAESSPNLRPGNAFDGLTDEAQDLALYISGRDANEGKHEAWGMDEATWARWIAAGQEIAAETERVLVGPWLDAWLDGEV